MGDNTLRSYRLNHIKASRDRLQHVSSHSRWQTGAGLLHCTLEAPRGIVHAVVIVVTICCPATM
jgi:hypothetical protein